jgi:hypothetical protein
MKYAAGIIGILGALAGLFLGFKWLSDLNSGLGQLATALAGSSGEAGSQLSALKGGTYSLIACGVIGLAISVMIIMRKFNRWANAAILIICGGLPLVFTTDAIFGTPMILAGLLALAVKYDGGPAPAAPAAPAV